MFPLGETKGTEAAFRHLTFEDIVRALQRHIKGDPGDLGGEFENANREAMKNNGRIISQHSHQFAKVFRVMTDLAENETIILVPSVDKNI